MANNVEQLYGTYAADVDTKFVKTPYEGLKDLADTVNYAAGCPDNECVNYTSSEVVKAVQGTQLVVICVGTGNNDVHVFYSFSKRKWMSTESTLTTLDEITRMFHSVFHF